MGDNGIKGCETILIFVQKKYVVKKNNIFLIQ